jgi:subtilisin family serine protease
MDTTEAVGLLQLQTPQAGFTLNKRYRLYTAGRSGEQNEAREVADPEACPPEQCYGRSLIRWQSKLATCARALRVGVIDTGVDQTHPTFGKQIVKVGHIHPTAARIASNMHGTGVLALLAGDPAGSTPGLIPEAQFYLADIFFAEQDGQPASETVELLKALEWMDVWDVRIINMSLTGPRDELVEAAIAKLTKKGVVIIAAAGNEGPNAPASYPAAYSQVIAVTAVNKDLRGYRYANRGEYIDLAAPGVGIWTALPGRKEGAQSGTSFAVPFVTSIVATMYRSLADKNKPAILSKLAVQDLGPPGKDPIYGQGLVLAPDMCGPSAPPAGASPAETVSRAPGGDVEAVATWRTGLGADERPGIWMTVSGGAD